MPPMIAPLITGGIGSLIGGLGSKDKNRQNQSSSGSFDNTTGTNQKINQFNQSDSNYGRNIDQVDMPVFTGHQGGIQTDLYSQLHSALMNPMATSPLFDTLKRGAIGQLNEAYNGAAGGLQDQLAGRGFGRSGMAAQNLQGLQSQRLGGIGSLQTQFAGQQLDQYNKTLQQALQYAFAAPGQHTTGQQTGFQHGLEHTKGVNTGYQHQLGSNQSQGMSSGQQGGNPAAGALTGLFGGLNSQPGGFNGFVNGLGNYLGQGGGGNQVDAYSLPQSSYAAPPQTLPNLWPETDPSELGVGGMSFIH